MSQDYAALNTRKKVLRLYENTRDIICHEDSLVNHRLAWMLTFNGFLFTAFGLSLSAKAALHGYSFDPKTSDEAYIQALGKVSEMLDSIVDLHHAIALAGVASSIAAAIGISAALKAARIAGDEFNGAVYLSPVSANEIIPYLPKIIGKQRTNVLGALCALMTPFIVSAPWCYLYLKDQTVAVDFCSIAPGTTAIVVSSIFLLTLVIVFSAFVLTPEIYDPFREEADRVTHHRITQSLLGVAFVAGAAVTAMLAIYYLPVLDANCGPNEYRVAAILLLIISVAFSSVCLILMINSRANRVLEKRAFEKRANGETD